MSDDSPTEVNASPPASEEVDCEPAEAQGKPRPTGRFERTLKDVADWAADSDLVEWVLEGVLVVLGIGALLLLSLFARDAVDSVVNWVFSHDPSLAIPDLALIGLVALAAVGAILRLAARWLVGKIRARRTALARRASDGQEDVPRGCRADRHAGDDPGGGVVLAVSDQGSAGRWSGWVACAVLLGAALYVLRRRADR